MTIKIDIVGAKEIEAALRELGDPKTMRAAMRDALRDAAKPMVDLAQSLVPVDQGDLKRSIKIRSLTRAREGVAVGIGIDQNEQPATLITRKTKSNGGKGGIYRDPGVAGVGPITEFGRPGQPARPFMRPAFDAEGEKTINRFADAAGQAIEKHAARLAKKRAKSGGTS